MAQKENNKTMLNEFRFTPDPHGAGPLWFHLKIDPAEIGNAQADDEKLRIVLEHYDTLAGAKSPTECCPVFKPAGQWWMRLTSGKSEQTPDGRICAVWTVNTPSDIMELALGAPYTDADQQQLLDRSRASWKVNPIGVSSGGIPIKRLANEYSADKSHTGGIYLISRLRGNDTPAAWVLDGMLQRFSSAKNNPFAIWAVPLADPDAEQSGAWYSTPDMVTAWTDAPARHEINVLSHDMARWRAGCQPVLAVNIQAAALHETKGIHCELPSQESHPEFHAQALKWANVIQHKLGAEFAASEFIRSQADPAADFHNWMAENSATCALTLHIPWATAGDLSFSQKKYREAGRSIADALIEKRK